MDGLEIQWANNPARPTSGSIPAPKMQNQNVSKKKERKGKTNGIPSSEKIENCKHRRIGNKRRHHRRTPSSERRGRLTHSPKPMPSFDEAMASIRQRMASGAARPKAPPPPDPRRKAAVELAASFKEQLSAHRNRVAAPFPALASARSLAEQTLSRQGQLKEAKSQIRNLESQLHQALSIKSHKESEYKCFAKSISDTTATNEKLKGSLMELRNKKDTRAAVISDQLQDLETREAKTNEDAVLRENLEAAVSWINKFLGLQVIAGEEGVKFVFDKIDLQCPQKEYSFCTKIDNCTYSLVQCNPPIKDFEELVKDFNLTGDLCKFLKFAREKFQASSVNDVPSVPFSPPVTSEDAPNQSNSRSKNKRLPAKRRSTGPSPGSARRSQRLLEGLHQRES